MLELHRGFSTLVLFIVLVLLLASVLNTLLYMYKYVLILVD